MWNKSKSGTLEATQQTEKTRKLMCRANKLEKSETAGNMKAYTGVKTTDQSSTLVAISDEISGYLASKSDNVNSLLAYPAVVEAFGKSNARLSSSAAIERLFTVASSYCFFMLRLNEHTCFSKVFFK
ncbi:hypothetical protein HELRODRAFT_158498 [Helobdella robusta]|uniref:Uncharacterized protein n=1 Tax=Helobdella robusta TaxID=6412 RepID=T1EMV0_HELRO|nr:hypothetical protein HELRODRAFT_158498 [Helobdella robusta]ESO12079.1 hypothetical protein HELRODRAFT_158498 [Helobdella robusta]